MPIIHSRYRNLQFGGRTRVKNEKIYENHKEGAFQQDNVYFFIKREYTVSCAICYNSIV